MLHSHRRELESVVPAWSRESVPIVAYDFPARFEGPPEVALVAGIHGNEVNGPAACAQLMSCLASSPHRVRSRIRVIPLVNSLGFDIGRRSWPVHNVDVYEQFGRVSEPNQGAVATSPQKLAAAVLTAIDGAQLCIDIHSSNRYMREAPQVRYYEPSDASLAAEYQDLSRRFRLPFIWPKRLEGAGGFDREAPGDPRRILSTVFAHRAALVGRRAFAFILMGGSSERVNKGVCDSLLRGIDAFLTSLGMLSAPDSEEACLAAGTLIPMSRDRPVPDEPSRPIVVSPDNLKHVLSQIPGVFMSHSPVGGYVASGTPVGLTVDLTNALEHREAVEKGGWLLSLRVHPSVYQGALIARLVDETQVLTEK